MVCREYDGRPDALVDCSIDQLTEQLLSINGIGRETADSIILYALEKPTFVVDAYTHRILSRHLCIDPQSDYQDIKDYCQYQLPQEVALYNQCHALLVRLGKEFCKPRPQCEGCPLQPYEHDIDP